MKRLLAIGFLLVFIMGACTRPDDNLVETRHGTSLPSVISPELFVIDSLMWQQPDSALMRLLPYFDTCRDVSRNVSTSAEYNRHYAHLLLAELLYKNDYALTNRAELLRAVDYFDSLVDTHGADTHGMSLRRYNRRDASHTSATMPQSIAFLDARAHYINGVGYYENDSVVKACKEYLKALEVMEGHFGERELVGQKVQFMAFTYTRLTDIFSDLYLHEQAIYFAQSSLTYYNRSNNPSWFTARMLNEIGSQYNMMDQSDSAVFYYQRAIEVLRDTAYLMYRDVATHLICLEYEEGSCPADSTISRMVHLLSKSESDLERSARCLVIGGLYYHERQYDSAWSYLNMVYHETPSIAIKKQAAEWLVEICKVQGRNDDILEYANFLVPFANQEENQSATKSELTELYKTFGQARQERQHQEEIRRRRYRSITVVSVWSFLTLVIMALFYYYNKNRKQHLESQMEAERHAHKMQQAALSGRLKRSNAALKEKEEKLYNETTKQNHYQQAESYCEEPICRRILSTCNDENNPIKSIVPVSSYADIALTDAQRAELKKVALAHYAPLFEMLRQQYPKLKEKDYLYCYLCLLGLDNAQISVLTQLSYRTVWEREKRLQHIFHKEERISVILNEIITN